jgi:hypothetical protein
MASFQQPNTTSLYEAIRKITSAQDVHYLHSKLQEASHTSHIFTIIVCILGLALNLFIMGTAIKCLRLDANRPGFASIANLAAVDILASLWFLLAIILPDSAGWTDQTLFFEALSMAEDRGFSEVYIKSQG